ncbi:MAG: hypothetical protein ACYC35_07560 [Pirellulales bacterium]
MVRHDTECRSTLLHASRLANMAQASGRKTVGLAEPLRFKQGEVAEIAR